MRRCEDCRIVLDTSAQYCPNCGKPLSAQQNAEANALVQSAKYHRARQEWDAALADAVEAMRLDPHNPAGPALLAAIYEERGMLDEARVWRQVAAELSSFGSPSRSSSIIGTGRSQVIGRWFLPILAVVVGIALTLFGVWVIKANNTQLPPKSSVRTKSSVPSADKPTTPLTQRTPSLSGRAEPSTTARTAAEQMIKAELLKSEAVATAKIIVDDVIADPRTGTAIVTYSTTALLSITRVAVLDTALTLARITFASHTEVKSVTLRCLAAGSDSHSTQILFVGDIARESLNALGQPVTAEAATAAFTHQWWNPRVR